MKPITIRKRSKLICELELSGNLNISLANELLEKLQEARSTRPKLRIRTSSLESMDTSILQILYAANRAFESCQLEEDSPAWHSSFKRAGLTDPYSSAVENN